MNGFNQKYSHYHLIAFIILPFTILITLGCSLFSANYWVHRLDDDTADQESESIPATATINAESANDSSFGSKCINSPGTEPCPVDACVVDESLYSVKNMISTELFGKANPTDYQCCADFQMINNSHLALVGFEHRVTEYADNWIFVEYPEGNTEQSGFCLNSFSRKDGKETLSIGVTEVIVLYANPHCAWIQWDEPGLVQHRVPVEPGCYSN